MESKTKNECQALVRYEPPIEAEPVGLVERLQVYAEKKREELRASLQGQRVHDPVTVALFGMTAWKFAAITAAGVALSIGTSLITSALTPKQKFVEERGRRTGDLVINSELGVLIPEVYFGMLSDGYGGSWVPAIVGWTSGIRKHVNVTSQPTGGGKFGGPKATTEVRETSYDIDWLLIWTNKGPCRVLRSKANSDVIYDVYGEISSYQGESASAYTGTTSLVAYDHASGGKEVTLGANGTVEWTNVKSNGAATRSLTIYYRTSNNTVTIELTINGGTPETIVLPSSNEAYYTYTVQVALNDGSANTVKIKNVPTGFNLGIDKIYCFPGHSAETATTGVLDPTVSPDIAYDPITPPDPTVDYNTPFTRFRGTPDEEPTGGQSGTMNHGGNANFAVYPGNTTQLPDPTYEAAIDAQYGAGSTPAYRGRCYEVDSAFYLTRWGGVIPNRIALVEHETIKNLAQFCDFMASRVGLASTDRDFTDLETITPRGLRIIGQRFEAREPMASAEIPFEVYFCEQEGKVVGKRKSAASSVDTLVDADFGWSDDEEPSDGPLTLLDVIEPNETDLPRRVDVRYIDLDRDGESGLQGYGRQVSSGEESLTLNLEWTLTRDEAQQLAQKEVFRRHTEKVCRYTLSWEHLWINVGDVFTATVDGTSYTILHAKDSGGIGLRECEGIILDQVLLTQSASANSYAYEQPVVPIPAMSISLFLDTPLLKAGDETVNNGAGFYWAVTPRTNTAQGWPGAGLYIQRNGEWFLLAETSLSATMGVVVSATGLSSDTSVIDRNGVIIVDLYGTDKTLQSVTEAALNEPNVNAAIIGDMVFQFATATQVGGYPNRWELSTLLNGRRLTESHVGDDFTDARFLFLDGAVQFVPMQFEDLNVTRTWKAVTSGQSLDDAASLSFNWTGNALKPPAPVHLRGTRNAAGDLLIEWTRRDRLALPLRDRAGTPLPEEQEIYLVQIYSGATLKHEIRTRSGAAPILWREESAGPSGYYRGQTDVRLDPYNSFFESTLFVDNVLGGYTEILLWDVTYVTSWWKIHFEPNFASPTATNFTVYEYNSGTGSMDLKYSGAHGTVIDADRPAFCRARFQMVNGELLVYDSYVNEGSSPVYRSAKRPSEIGVLAPYYFTTSGATSAYQKSMTSIGKSQAIYPATLQTAHFGSIQSSIKVRVMQESALVGVGPYCEGTI